MPITVKEIDDNTFGVTVEGRTTTTHTVTVSEEYWRKLTDRNVTRHTLVEKSFEFLLEREENTSILKTFDLSQIAHYFPAYERTIRQSLAGA